VEIGHKTLIAGGDVRTGVTAVWPRGKKSNDPVFGGFFSQNGNGDMTGTHWLTESGFLDGPVLITNTNSVGVARDAYLGWLVKNHRTPGTNAFEFGWFTYPVVAETWDGFLNDINGFHIKPADVEEALVSAAQARFPKVMSAAARAWSATALKGASARLHGNWHPDKAATPLACWFSAIVARATNSVWMASRLARRSRSKRPVPPHLRPIAKM